MAEHIIEVRVDEKIASVVGDPLYVCGNSDYIVKFHFDAEWAGHGTKTARFIKSNKEYFDIVFSGDQCAVPIIDNTPYVRIGVYAGNLCTTTAAIVNAQRSILCGSGVPADPDNPDVYAQMMSRLDDYALKGDAAPAGYGLGGAVYTADLNKAIKPGWYYTDSKTVNTGRYYTIVHVKAYRNEQFVEQVQTDMNLTNFDRLHRYSKDGGATWTEEWENPLLALGVEYRTTERHDGKPVYTKLVDLGESANLKVVYVLEGNARIIRHEAMYGGTTSLPFINDTLDNGYSIWTMVDKGGVAIKMCCGTYRIGGAMTAQIWYTKD